MATYTTNYSLTKPTLLEVADVRVLNDNTDTIDEIMHKTQISIADAYNPSLTYEVGDLVMHVQELFKCIVAVTTPEAFDSTKWERTTAAAEGSGGGGGIDYSTTEQDIGLKWIDGKPIYQRVIVDTAPTVSSDGTFVTKDIAVIQDIDEIIVLSGAVTISSNNNKYVMPYYTNSGRSIKVMYDGGNETIRIVTDGTAFSGQACKIIVQYTKTTD